MGAKYEAWLAFRTPHGNMAEGLTNRGGFQFKMSLNDILNQFLKITACEKQKHGAMLQFPPAKRYSKKIEKQKRYAIRWG